MTALNEDLKGTLTPFDKFWTFWSPSFVSIDNLLSESELNDFKLNAIKLENIQPKDWRVDRKGLLELVDPFLYCFTAEKSTYNEEERQFYNFETPCASSLEQTEYSTKFQLLPTELLVDVHSKQVKICSYINNLDMKQHMNLYKSIETILTKVVPHFENILSQLRKINFKDEVKVDLSGRNLQMIIAMKNVHLTPENSNYAGSDWHTEGLRNERIVASAVFFYDVTNILDSKMDFTVQVSDNEHLQLGNVTAQANRLVVFPNILKHIVRPFELESKSMPGHRKILNIFLVDPGIRIISTAYVTPQQNMWSLKAAKEYREQARMERQAGPQPSPVETEASKVVKRPVAPLQCEAAKESREQPRMERQAGPQPSPVETEASKVVKRPLAPFQCEEPSNKIFHMKHKPGPKSRTQFRMVARRD